MIIKVVLFVLLLFAINFFVGVYYTISPEVQIDAALNQLNNTESGAVAMRGLEQAVNTPVAFLVAFIGFIVIFYDECKRLCKVVCHKLGGKEL